MMKNKLKSNKKKVENLGSNTHFPRSTPHLFSVKSLTEKKFVDAIESNIMQSLKLLLFFTPPKNSSLVNGTIV